MLRSASEQHVCSVCGTLASSSGSWMREELQRLMQRVCRLEWERGDLEESLRTLSDENEQLCAELRASRVEAGARAAEVTTLQSQTQVLMEALQDLMAQQQSQWQSLSQLQQQSHRALPVPSQSTRCVACGANLTGLHVLNAKQLEVFRTIEVLSRRRDELKSRLTQYEASSPAEEAQGRPEQHQVPRGISPGSEGKGRQHRTVRYADDSTQQAWWIQARPGDSERWKQPAEPHLSRVPLQQLPHSRTQSNPPSPQHDRSKTTAPSPSRDRSNSYFQALGIPRAKLEEWDRRGRR